MASLGTRLYEFRKNHLEVTQKEFAQKCGVEQAHISHWEKDRVKPDRESMSKMEKAFPSLNMEWLMDGIGEMLIDSRNNRPPIQDSSILKNASKDLEKLKLENEVLRMELEFWKSKVIGKI